METPPVVDPSAPLLLTIAEAARLLNISRAMLYTIINHGDILTVRYGRVVRISTTELLRWIAANTVRDGEVSGGHK